MELDRHPGARPILWIVASLCLAGCGCGDDGAADGGGDSGPADSGRPDAGRGDAGRPDAGRRDAGAAPDAGALVPFPDGWEPVPFLPEWCDAWRPIGDAASAVPALAFEPCVPHVPGCERVVVDWRRSERISHFLLARKGAQTWGDAPIMFQRPYFTRDAREYMDVTLFDVTGRPLAVWRSRYATGTIRRCLAYTIAVAGEELAIAFEVSEGLEERGLRAAIVVAGDIDRAQRIDEPLRVLSIEDLLTVGNLPDELLYDGQNLIVHGALGGVYLGAFGDGPWSHVATARTDDYQNSTGMLFDGAFYWSSLSADATTFVIKRRDGSSTASEVFMEDPVGWPVGFNTDGTWAVWSRSVDDPPDGERDRSEIVVARIDGDLDPTNWSPEVITQVTYPNRVNGISRPIYYDGYYAYLVNPRLAELVDLERRRVYRLPYDSGVFWWTTVLHLGPEYFFLVRHGRGGVDGLHRYRISELEGWEPGTIGTSRAGAP